MKKLSIIAAVSIVALAALAYGQMGGYGMGGRGMGPGMMGECVMGGKMMEAEQHMSRHLMGLDLDEQQKTLIGEIKSRMMKETIKKSADMRIVHIDLRDLLSKDPVDMKAVEAKVKQMEMMRTEMHLSHIKCMEDIKTKLTPEQRKKFREMFEDGPMMEEMEMKHEHKRGMKDE
ncbi:MAG: periplasmic heavy metal sensor [Nitrospiraceae bacterium]|nr:MAG: periplasmic heavy metal sensor [Nitrospiraceae bacterium]